MLAALVAMWGSAFLFTKVAVSALPPETVVAGRLAIAAIGLTALLLALGKALPRGRRLWLFFLALAVLGNALPFWLISWGQQRIDSGLAGILMAIMPLTTLVLAHFFVVGERLNPVRLAGFVLGFIGIVALVGPEALLELEVGGTALLSELSVLGGAVCYAVNTIVARRRPPSDPLAAGAGVMILASAITIPLALAGGPPPVDTIPPTAAFAVAVLGIVSTALATVVYFKLVSAAGPTFVSLINYLIPLWAVVVGMVFLGETPEWRALGALALILSGIALSELGRRTRVEGT
jgi:drug/metabolite transporter (DMT)-like permease